MDLTLATHKTWFLALVRHQTHSSLILASGDGGVSGREFMMFAGGARESEGARASQGSSVSTFIVLIFFFLLSSFSFFFGRVKSQRAGGERIPWSQLIRHKSLNCSLLRRLYLRKDPFRLKLVLESISPRLTSDVIKSGWSWKYQTLNITVHKNNCFEKSLFLLAASSSSLGGFAALSSSPALPVLFYLWKTITPPFKKQFWMNYQRNPISVIPHQ